MDIAQTRAQYLIHIVCQQLATLLISKNTAYGNSALEPVRIFSKASPEEQLLVRIDDKLSRLARGRAAGEDVVWDLLGYLVLYRVSQLLKTILEGTRADLKDAVGVLGITQEDAESDDDLRDRALCKMEGAPPGMGLTQANVDAALVNLSQQHLQALNRLLPTVRQTTTFSGAVNTLRNMLDSKGWDAALRDAARELHADQEKKWLKDLKTAVESATGGLFEVQPHTLQEGIAMVGRLVGYQAKKIDGYPTPGPDQRYALLVTLKRVLRAHEPVGFDDNREDATDANVEALGRLLADTRYTLATVIGTSSGQTLPQMAAEIVARLEKAELATRGAV